MNASQALMGQPPLSTASFSAAPKPYKLFTFPKLLKQHPISTCGTFQWFALKSKQVIVPWDPQMRFTAPFMSCPTQSHFWSACWWILSPSCMTEQSPVLFSAIIVWGLNLFITETKTSQPLSLPYRWGNRMCGTQKEVKLCSVTLSLE